MHFNTCAAFEEIFTSSATNLCDFFRTRHSIARAISYRGWNSYPRLRKAGCLSHWCLQWLYTHEPMHTAKETQPQMWHIQGSETNPWQFIKGRLKTITDNNVNFPNLNYNLHFYLYISVPRYCNTIRIITKKMTKYDQLFHNNTGMFPTSIIAEILRDINNLA